jgi:hypothetical protein
MSIQSRETSRSSFRAVWAAFATLGVLLVAGVAAAEAPREAVSLRWTAPDQCPDDIQLVHAVEALLGQRLLETREQALTIRAAAQGDLAHGFAAKVSFSSPQGAEERFLEHPSCEQLVRALALVVALAIDPERVRVMEKAALDSTAANGVRPPPVSPPPTALPTGNTEQQCEPAAKVAPDFALRGARFALHGLAGAGPLPNIGAGLEATLGWRRRAFRAELVTRYWVPREEPLDAAHTSALRLGLATVGARACWLPTSGAWQVAACAGGNLGDMNGTGLGLENPQRHHALYADVAGSLGLSYTRWRLLPEGGFELSGALARPPFGIVEDGNPVEVYRPAAWGLTAFLGCAFEL